jgi:hypothetical protein
MATNPQHLSSLSSKSRLIEKSCRLSFKMNNKELEDVIYILGKDVGKRTSKDIQRLVDSTSHIPFFQKLV